MKCENIVLNSSPYFSIKQHEICYLVFSMCLIDYEWKWLGIRINLSLMKNFDI